MLNRLQNYVGAGVFDTDEVHTLAAAFDDAWKSVQERGATFSVNGHAEAVRELLALRIIVTARQGERDRVRLRDDALLYLAQTNLKCSGL